MARAQRPGDEVHRLRELILELPHSPMSGVAHETVRDEPEQEGADDRQPADAQAHLQNDGAQQHREDRTQHDQADGDRKAGVIDRVAQRRDQPARSGQERIDAFHRAQGLRALRQPGQRANVGRVRTQPSTQPARGTLLRQNHEDDIRAEHDGHAQTRT